ncbi:hypothetical protein H4582DRAFT_2125611 [Lactarius indigo]|nr:hypothetical protein H4582DRAFT_2125611 [Lactarius indigo]
MIGGKKRFPGPWNGQKGDAFEFDADKRLGPRWYYHARDPRRIGPSAMAKQTEAHARPDEMLDDPNRLVSGADCRLVAFEAISEATKSWITIPGSLGDVYKDRVERYACDTLVIFCLAP